jgi:hypothetical protein
MADWRVRADIGSLRIVSGEPAETSSKSARKCQKVPLFQRPNRSHNSLFRIALRSRIAIFLESAHFEAKVALECHSNGGPLGRRIKRGGINWEFQPRGRDDNDGTPRNKTRALLDGLTNRSDRRPVDRPGQRQTPNPCLLRMNSFGKIEGNADQARARN